jgi:hypothetical protein
MADKQDEALDTKIADEVIKAVNKRRSPKEDVIVPTMYKNPENSEGLVEVFIDPVMTRGGLMTNGTKYMGRVKVEPHIAEDLMRRQQEIQEVANWQVAPTANKPQMRMQNHQVVEQQYLADPENRGRKGWTDEFGLLDPWQWQFLSEPFKEQLKETRKQMYGL